MILRDKVFESGGILWSVEQSVGSHALNNWIAYPMCITKHCYSRLSFENTTETTCPSCNRKYTISVDFAAMRTSVDIKYQGSKFWDAPIINLDLLPTSVSAREEDENYWVQVKLGQKDGKRMAVVFIGDKTNKSGEKSHLFIDVDDEQIRFDKGDEHPTNVVSMLVAHFSKSTHTIEKK